MRKTILTLSTLIMLALSSSGWATPITCGSADRSATLDPAMACETGLRNPKGDSFFGGGWTDAGELTRNGTDGFLTVILTSGSWGKSPIEAIWTIDPAFWLANVAAVISTHVGNGKGDPDWWAWTIETGALTGKFTYEDFDRRGGGLSNIRLWSKPGPVGVPEPGTLMLLGLGVLGMSVGKRRRKA